MNTKTIAGAAIVILLVVAGIFLADVLKRRGVTV